MADPRLHPGGRVEWHQNERLSETYLDRIGKIAMQTVTSMLAMYHRDAVADAPMSGFAGDDCLVTVDAAPLTIAVAPGVGWYYDSAETDAFAPHWEPIVVPVEDTEVLSAHHATLARIDIVCLAPAETQDQAAAVYIRDPSLGTVTTPSNSKRSKPSYTLTVVAGTPGATPSAPATPSGYIKIAECAVPATSGTVVITDTRPLLVLGQAHAPDPRDEYIADEGFVPGTSTELQVTASSPVSMVLRIARGEAVVKGASGVRRIRYNATTVTLDASHVTHDRRDLIVADEDGTITVVKGVEDGSAVVTAVADGQVPLATVLVDNAAVSIADAKILDRRIRFPFGPDQLQTDSVTTLKIAEEAVTQSRIAEEAVGSDQIEPLAVTTPLIAAGAVTAVKQSVVPVIPQLTVGATVGADTPVTVNMRDPDAVNVSRVVRCKAEVFYADMELIPEADSRHLAVTAGTGISTTNKPTILFDTDASGDATIKLVSLLSATYYVVVTPLNTPGYPSIVSITIP